MLWGHPGDELLLNLSWPKPILKDPTSSLETWATVYCQDPSNST